MQVSANTASYASPQTPPCAAGCQCPACLRKADQTAATPDTKTNKQLDPEQQSVIVQLKARDREVREHEQAHIAASGGLSVSGPVYSYQKGPDGQHYAVGGEVQIDTSPGRDPAETISKAQRIRAAALAPAEPSGQDRMVAQAASRMEQEARQQLRVEQADQTGNARSSAQKLQQAYQLPAEPPASQINTSA